MPLTTRFTYFKKNENGETERVTVDIPTVWSICDACHGDGTTAAHLGIISDEDSADEEFMENYLDRRYDKPCPDCKGKGRVAGPCETWLRDHPEVADALDEDMREEARYVAECRAERRFLGLE